MSAASEIGEQLVQLAQQRNDKDWLTQAHRSLGWTLFCLGRLHAAREHLELALELYDGSRSKGHSPLHGTHPGVAGLVNLALLDWFSGLHDRSLARSQAAIELARDLGRPHTLAYALAVSAAVHECRGEAQATSELAAEAVLLANKHGLAYWVAWGSVLHGWALTQVGKLPEGLSKLEFGIEKYRQTGAQLFEASSLALLAEGYRRGGRLEEALQATSRALERGELAEGYFYAAEIHRIRGELLVEARADEAGAEASFRQGIAIANAQQALSLELRAAQSQRVAGQSRGACRKAARFCRMFSAASARPPTPQTMPARSKHLLVTFCSWNGSAFCMSTS